MAAHPFLSRLRFADLRRMAGLRAFRQGEAAYEQGLVRDVARRGSHLGASVLQHGAPSPRVEVRATASDWTVHCNCANESEEMCEHAVAVLLWCLEESLVKRKAADTINVDDVEHVLRAKTKDDLVDLLLQMGLRDDRVMNVLELDAARAAGKRVDTAHYRLMIRNALSRKFVDYYHTGDFQRNLEGLREDLDRLREAGFASEAHETLGYFLEKALDRYREVEEDGARAFDTLTHIIESYAAALPGAGLAPEAAAEEVFALIDAADASFLEPIVAATAGPLGPRGLAVLERIARARLETARGMPGPTVSRRKFRHLVKAAIRASGDDARYLEALRTDLEGATDYRLAAERLASLGRSDEATALARLGLAASPKNDPQLLALLSTLAEAQGDIQNAITLALDAFDGAPSLDLLQRARGLAGPKAERARVIERLRTRLRREPGSALQAELLLAEGDLGAIVKGAQRGHYPAGLVERVARVAEAKDTAAAAELYEELVRRHVGERTAEGDRHAAHAMHALAALCRRAGSEARIGPFLARLARQQRGRGALIERLRAAVAV